MILVEHATIGLLGVDFGLLLFRKGHSSGAGEGNRTLVSGLGSPRSTIEPHPHFCKSIILFEASSQA